MASYRPAVFVVSDNGKWTVIYNPVPGKSEGTARKTTFVVLDDQLIVTRAFASAPMDVAIHEIDHIRIVPDANRGYALVAQLADTELELMGAIPDAGSARELGQALAKQFDIAFQASRVDAGSGATASSRFRFVSKPYGKALSLMLGILLVVQLAWTVFGLAVGPAIDDPNSTEFLAASLLAMVQLIPLLVACALFLVWLHRVHRDLAEIVLGYPISPGGAVARVSIPLYNLWGNWQVFNTISDQFLPSLEWWARTNAIIVAFSFLGLPGTVRFESWPQWLLDVSFLVTTIIWFGITLKVHRALAERKAELPAPPPGSAFTSTGSALTVSAVARATGSEVSSDSGELPLDADSPRLSENATGRGRLSRPVQIGLAVAGLAACGLITVLATRLPGWIETGMGVFDQLAATSEEWYDEEYDRLYAALDERWGPDDSIPQASASFYFGELGTDKASDITLVILMQTTTTCTLKPVDPCADLANEFARITLENYSRIDEIDHLQVVVTQEDIFGPVSFTRSVDKNLTVARWRDELGLQ
jgi:hypothetical protein